MKIIIAGAGEVGIHLAKMLSNENHEITIIDPDENKLKNLASNLDVLSYNGSATSIQVLKNAGIQKSDLFISVCNSEEVNINASVLAKKLGTKRCISRIDNLEYLDPENMNYFIDLGVDYMIYPELLSANEVVRMLQSAGNAEVATFADGKVALYVIRLDDDAKFVNKTISEINASLNNPGFCVVAIARNGETMIPKGDEQLLRNDMVYILTTKAGINPLLESSGKNDSRIRNLMILGGSRIGKNIAKELGRKFSVKLIERDRQKSFQLSNYLSNTLVINGDGTNFDLLMEEGLSSMDVFVAVTGNSETNMLSCLLAKRMGVKKTICEIENIEYISLGENMGIDTVINKKLISAGRIFGFTTRDDVSSVKCLTGTDAEVMEFVAKPDSKITREPLRNIDFPKDAIIGAWVRGRQSAIANKDTEIKPFDRVIVFALPSAIGKIGKFFV
jgi:trk system potassium uptake protein TrkA